MGPAGKCHRGRAPWRVREPEEPEDTEPEEKRVEGRTAALVSDSAVTSLAVLVDTADSGCFRLVYRSDTGLDRNHRGRFLLTRMAQEDDHDHESEQHCKGSRQPRQLR